MLNDLLAKNQSSAKLYVEDVFSTWLYTGTGASQTITNGIDLAGKGGLVWTKFRSGSFGTEQHALIDTARGANYYLSSDSTAAQVTSYSNVLTAFNSNGYTLGADTSSGKVNYSAQNYASWTFRKSAKFFDIVTWTGNATARDISHSLGVSPGLIIIKRTDAVAQWPVWHRSLPANNTLFLNTTDNTQTASGYVTSVSANTFSIGTSGNVNATGGSYVAYLFAHDTTADGVIQCGSFTGNGSNSGPSINLGWEPQWVMIKRTDTSGNWWMMDVMRGMSQTDSLDLQANASTGDLTDSVSYARPLATGFSPGTSYSGVNASGGTYIYLAIRRGPMRVPTDATKVFSPVIWTGNNASNRVVGTLNSVDLMFNRTRTTTTQSWWVTPRLTNGIMSSDLTSAEGSATPYIGFAVQSGVNLVDPTAGNVNASTYTSIGDMFCRAPGFFDVVCYTTTNSTNQRITHNLGVAPEMIITKNRGSAGGWFTYVAALGRSKYLSLNGTAASNGFGNDWGTSDPTSTDFGYNTQIFQSSPYSGNTVVAYLFATCPGVSKVGSYTGTGTTLQINCGFTNGARFVLIKRTDSTGDWYVYDSARGIVAGNDPYLLLNSTAAEVTNTDYVDAYSAGFELSSTAPAALNANGGTYIYLAIA